MPFEDGKPDLAVPGGGHFEDEEPTSSLWRRLVADPALSLLKGAVGVPEAAVGLADLATGGYAGKGAEAVGFRPKEAKEYLDTLLSPEQQEANRYVQEAEGFFPTIGRALERPSTIAHSVLESLPSVGAGGVLARGAMTAAPKLAPLVAGAMGEGAVSAGSTAEQIRQATPTGTLSLPQAALAAGSGAATGAFGVAGGKLAHRLGIADIDTLIAGGKLPEGARKSLARRIGEGIFIEGPIEELPQSAQEQIAQNLALGKPVMEGVPEAGAMGMLAGSVMGGGVAALPTKASTQEILDRNPDPRKAAEELLQKAAEDVIRGTDTLGATISPIFKQITDKQPETPNDQPQLNPVPSEQATPETTTQAPAEAEAVIPESGTIAPKTVGGIPVSAQSDEQLQALAAAPETPANTRHAAVAALQSRNPEARPAPPEVESPILETPKGAESSDRGVAPTQEGGLPETFGAKYAENGDTLRIREGIPGAGTGTVQLLDRHGEGAQAFVRLPNGAEVSANLGNYELVASPERAAQIRAKFPQDFSAPAETAQPAEIPPTPAAQPSPAVPKPQPEAAPAVEPVREPWQYTRKEWIAENEMAWKKKPPLIAQRVQESLRKNAFDHGALVAQAVDSGKPVPAAVLADYSDLAPPVEPVKAPTEPVKTPVPDHIANAGKMVERFQGQYKKGMGITPARAAQKRLAAERPELTWTVEKSTIPEFPDRFDVVGREPAESPAQPAVPAQPAAEKATTNKESLPVDETTASDLRRFAGEAGWEERGGKLIRSGEGASKDEIAAGRQAEAGEVIGRTKWIPKQEWFQRMRQDLGNKGLSDQNEIESAADKYLTGEKLTPKAQRTIDWMLAEIKAEREFYAKEHGVKDDLKNDITPEDVAEAGLEISGQEEAIADLMATAVKIDEAVTERAAMQFEGDDTGLVAELERIINDQKPKEARPGAEDSAKAPTLELTAPTEEELKARADAQEAAAKAEEAATKAREEADRAERERKEIAQRSESTEFSLQGSEAVDRKTQAQIDAKRAADQLAGQGDIFSRPANTLSPADLLRAAADKMDSEAAAKPSESSATLAPEMRAKRSETATPPVLSEKEGSIPDKNEGDTDKGAALFERNTPIFYSALARGLESANIKSAPAPAWAQYIKGLVNNGAAKQDEVEWTGINDWLTTQTGKVTKEQVSAFMEQGGVRVTEQMLGEDVPQKRLQKANDALIDYLVANEHFTRNGARDYALDVARNDLTEAQRTSQSPDVERLSAELRDAYVARTDEPSIPTTKFEQYQLLGSVPGSYRELVLTLPEKRGNVSETDVLEQAKVDAQGNGDTWAELDDRQQLGYINVVRDRFSKHTNTFKSSHFPDAGNYLAHTRVNDRILPDGRKVLFVEEIQSDRGAAIRKSQKAIQSAVDIDFEGIVKRMEKAGVLEVNCD